MTIASVVAGGTPIGTLHAGYCCSSCGEPLAILWARTRLGLSPCAADLAARPVTHCPRCAAEVDALGLWGPADDDANIKISRANV